MVNLKIVQEDNTTVEVDAIVNAAPNPGCWGRRVDGAIHRAAGPELLTMCRKHPAEKEIRCPAGEARITEAGNLKAKYVIIRWDLCMGLTRVQ